MVLETLAEAILGNDKNDPSKMANRRMYGYQNCVKNMFRMCYNLGLVGIL